MEIMDKVIDRVDLSWNKDLIIRYLYIKMAVFFQKDLEYFLASTEEKKRQLKQGCVRKNNEVNCMTLSNFYVDLFKIFGIRAKIVQATSADFPLYGVIVEGDNGWYFLDPINDLFYNQYGLRPPNFGVTIISKTFIVKEQYPFLINLPKAYIESLDRILGFEFLDEYFQRLRLLLSQEAYASKFFGVPKDNLILIIQKKIEFAQNHLINLGNVHGLLERERMYAYIKNKIGNRKEKNRTQIYLSSNNLVDAKVSISLSFPGQDFYRVYEEVKKDELYTLRRKIVRK